MIRPTLALVIALTLSHQAVGWQQSTKLPDWMNRSGPVRVWSDSYGKFSVNAILLKLESDRVYLKRVDNGKIAVVPLTRLSDADNAWLLGWQPNDDSSLAETLPPPASAPPSLPPAKPEFDSGAATDRPLAGADRQEFLPAPVARQPAGQRRSGQPAGGGGAFAPALPGPQSGTARNEAVVINPVPEHPAPVDLSPDDSFSTLQAISEDRNSSDAENSNLDSDRTGVAMAVPPVNRPTAPASDPDTLSSQWPAQPLVRDVSPSISKPDIAVVPQDRISPRSNDDPDTRAGDRSATAPGSDIEPDLDSYSTPDTNALADRPMAPQIETRFEPRLMEPGTIQNRDSNNPLAAESMPPDVPRLSESSPLQREAENDATDGAIRPGDAAIPSPGFQRPDITAANSGELPRPRVNPSTTEAPADDSLAVDAPADDQAFKPLTTESAPIESPDRSELTNRDPGETARPELVESPPLRPETDTQSFESANRIGEATEPAAGDQPPEITAANPDQLPRPEARLPAAEAPAIDSPPVETADSGPPTPELAADSGSAESPDRDPVEIGSVPADEPPALEPLAMDTPATEPAGLDARRFASGEPADPTSAEPTSAEPITTGPPPLEPGGVSRISPAFAFSEFTDSQLLDEIDLTARVRWDSKSDLSDLLELLPPDMYLQIQVTGDPLHDVLLLGHFELGELTDESGSRLVPVRLPPSVPNPLKGWVVTNPIELQDINISGSDTVLPQEYHVLGQIKLKRPDKLPQQIERAVGSVKLLFATELRQIAIPDIVRNPGPVEHELLQQHEISIDVQRPDDITLVVEATGNVFELSNISLNVPGDQEFGQAQTDSSGSIWYQFTFIDPIPADVELTIEVATATRELTIPFDFSKLQVPLELIQGN